MKLTLLCIAISGLALQNTTLSDLETKFNFAQKANQSDREVALTEVQAGVEKLITEDKLKEASDFRRAEALFSAPNLFFEHTRVKYELLLTAAKLGDSEAIGRIPNAWDNFIQSLGRNRRLVPIHGKKMHLIVKPAPRSVTRFWESPKKSIQLAKEAKSIPEVQSIVDADQKDRDRDWSKVDPKEWEKVAQADIQRLTKIKKFANAGTLTTGADYFNAALVCQHGDNFEDYALAHELSVCAMILGYEPRTSAWLAAASYDRMLLNMGHRQRYGTQSYIIEGKQSLSPLDSMLMNDTMRFTVSHIDSKKIKM